MSNTPTKLDEAIAKLIYGILIDGQNQIHDLRDGKVTPEEIDKRTRASVGYFSKEVKAALAAIMAEIIGDNDGIAEWDDGSFYTNQMHDEQRQRAAALGFTVNERNK